MKNQIKILNKNIIKKILINNNYINNYFNINNIKQNSINKVNNIKLLNNNNEYNYYNRIYKWNNNKLINNINIDNIVKIWLKYIFTLKFNNNLLSTINSSEPLFLHTNDKLIIYIRILMVKSSLNNKSNHYNNTINKLINNNINIITILNKIYNKKVNIIPITINNNAGGMNEFIIGSKSVYSPYKYNITINKLNKYIVPKSTINKNSYINKNSLYNIIYYNFINNNFNNINSDTFINNIITILPNINNHYITGYNLHYAGKLPKADSSARTIKRNTMTGTIHNTNIINKTLYSYNNNGLASTKATIAQAPFNN